VMRGGRVRSAADDRERCGLVAFRDQALSHLPPRPRTGPRAARGNLADDRSAAWAARRK
jgi:hypothetical protein